MSVISANLSGLIASKRSLKNKYTKYLLLLFFRELETDQVGQAVHAPLSVATHVMKYPWVEQMLYISLHKSLCATSFINDAGFLQSLLTTQNQSFFVADLPITTPTSTYTLFLLHILWFISDIIYTNKFHAVKSYLTRNGVEYAVWVVCRDWNYLSGDP